MATTSESKLASTSYTHWEPSGSIDAIVIGSGLGGLTAAAMLAREAGQRPGSRCWHCRFCEAPDGVYASRIINGIRLLWAVRSFLPKDDAPTC